MKQGKTWKPREDYLPLILKAKKLFPTLLAHVKPEKLFLCGFWSKRGRHIARITRNKAPWGLLVDKYDYVIEFWSTRFDSKPEEYKIYVAVHELLHIPQGGQVPHARQWRKLIDHDLEDFAFLRQLYGIHLESVSDILKGEKALLQKDGPRRFPRTLRIK